LAAGVGRGRRGDSRHQAPQLSRAENCAAVNLKLTREEIGTLSNAFPLNITAGRRYPEKQLAALGI